MLPRLRLLRCFHEIGKRVLADAILDHDVISRSDRQVERRSQASNFALTGRRFGVGYGATPRKLPTTSMGVNPPKQC